MRRSPRERRPVKIFGSSAPISVRHTVWKRFKVGSTRGAADWRFLGRAASYRDLSEAPTGRRRCHDCKPLINALASYSAACCPSARFHSRVAKTAARPCATRLRRRRFQRRPRLAEQLSSQKIEVAFVALHGRYGEYGRAQGLLECLQLPYTGSPVLASAAGMSKVFTSDLCLALRSDSAVRRHRRRASARAGAHVRLSVCGESSAQASGRRHLGQGADQYAAALQEAAQLGPRFSSSSSSKAVRSIIVSNDRVLGSVEIAIKRVVTTTTRRLQMQTQYWCRHRSPPTKRRQLSTPASRRIAHSGAPAPRAVTLIPRAAWRHAQGQDLAGHDLTLFGAENCQARWHLDPRAWSSKFCKERRRCTHVRWCPRTTAAVRPKPTPARRAGSGRRQGLGCAATTHAGPSRRATRGSRTAYPGDGHRGRDWR